MAENDPAALVPPGERVEADPTPGMVREAAIGVDGIWSGFVTTEARGTTGWHHHGDYETSIHVVDGALRMEPGPGGAVVFDARPGDFVHVPKYAVHREANPVKVASHLVVTRAGTGPPTFNVDGSAPA